MRSEWCLPWPVHFWHAFKDFILTSWDAAVTQYSRGLAYMLRASHHLCWTSRGKRKKNVDFLNSFICERLTMGCKVLMEQGSFHFCVMPYLSQLRHSSSVRLCTSLTSELQFPPSSFKQTGPDEPLRPFLAFRAWSSVSSAHRSLRHSLHWSTGDSLGYLTADKLSADDSECVTTLKSCRKFVLALLKGSVDIRVTKHS